MQKLKLQKSVLPVYLFGLVWLLYALFFPLYKPLHFLIVLALSLAVFFIGRALIPSKMVAEAEEPVEANTGDKQADQLIDEARASVRAMAQKANTINSPKVRAQFARLDKVSTDILNHVSQHPAKAKNVRKFFNYYLPTTQKLLDTYVDLEAQSAKGQNITGTMTSIEGILDTIVGAFETQLDKLFADKAMDISADITVMESMLAQEGLLEKTRQKPTGQ